jgi:hypothetical protein
MLTSVASISNHTPDEEDIDCCSTGRNLKCLPSQ